MLARYLNAPLLLLVWQVAPVEVRRDEGGRFRVGISIGHGAFSFRDHSASRGLDCNGNPDAFEPARTETDAYGTLAFSAEARASNLVRLYAAVGKVDDQSGERQGTFAAGQALYEKRYFGLGLGVATFGGNERSIHPSLLARVSPFAGVSLQADYYHPNASMGLVGGPRAGLAINQSNDRKARVFIGVAGTPVPDSAHRAGAYFEGSVPIEILSRKAGLTMSAFFAGQRGGGVHLREVFSIGFGGWIAP